MIDKAAARSLDPLPGAGVQHRDVAVGAAVDGLLHGQTGYDVDNLSRYLRRDFRADEHEQLHSAILRAKRYTFLASGGTMRVPAEYAEIVMTKA